MSSSKKQYSFFEKPISKDNFWNLVFWFGMSTGFSLSLVVSEVLHIAFLSTAIIWLTIIFIPFIVVKNNPVKYDHEAKIFLNSEGLSLEKKQPKTLFWVVVYTILAPVMAGAFLDQHKNEIPDIVATLMIISTFFCAPALYFSILECPITWLFNKNIWTANPAKGQDIVPYHLRNQTFMDQVQDPCSSYLLWNKFHKKN
ncbi:MAG: hypothetical protein ACEY3D_00060 [Rickettsia sp.]|uniref:hypothetical protein n=1 Tax=Rickettsia sp. TaxID=789 RepID=UPI00397E4705